MRIYKVGYNLTATKEGRCLNNCTGHGTCSEDAICHCQDNWTGGDCSVNAKGGCQPGSRKPMPMYVCILRCPHSSQMHCLPGPESKLLARPAKIPGNLHMGSMPLQRADLNMV